jgi:DNA helicase-2/ATP-dependent DNA helicase PcrA
MTIAQAVDAQLLVPQHRRLNPQQRAAVEYGVGGEAAPGPLLIIAGAGTGKTNTLAHRVAHLVMNKIQPDRILLLTFSRRAAQEMTRRAQRILGEARATNDKHSGHATEITWSGTFHGIGGGLLEAAVFRQAVGGEAAARRRC